MLVKLRLRERSLVMFGQKSQEIERLWGKRHWIAAVQ